MKNSQFRADAKSFNESRQSRSVTTFGGKMRGSLISILASTLMIAACSPLSGKRVLRTVEAEEERLQNHIGLEIFDPEKGRTLLSHRADRYYTPASNTKVLTLFTALNILRDSVPSIRYVERNDSTIFWGFGDPAFLNSACFENQRAFNFLKNAKGVLCFSTANFQTTAFGSGWAWDDYNDYYSAERSPMPIYGNTFSVYPLPDGTLVRPAYFQRYLKRGPAKTRAAAIRETTSNAFTLHPGLNGKFRTFVIPFRTEPREVVSLLRDTLQRNVALIAKRPEPDAKVLYSVPVDSLYKPMMQESDNHIAEQLLLMCSAVLSDSLQPETAIRYMHQNYFNQYPDPPVWVDGSGLSRYNLFTPRFMVRLWKDMYDLVPRERLFALLATGGKPGTLKNWFKDEGPYVFGKTGTLSNNHSLSGYLVTKSGKTLIFAFMNANYVKPTSEVRANIQRILNLYYENY